MVSWYWPIAIFCGWNYVNFCQSAQVLWNKFASSQYYENVRILTSPENLTTRLYIFKDFPAAWAQMECTKLCTLSTTCEAFNFYETETAFVCELLPVNLCSSGTTKLAFVNWPGSSVWDRLRTSMKCSCYETQFPPMKNVACENLRPGCLGSWPNCYSCAKSCIDCKLRYNFTGGGACTMWPEGDTPWSIPIFGKCYDRSTYLILRTLDLNSAHFTEDYRMPFPDMNRIYKLNTYSLVKFVFFDSNYQYVGAIYKNSFVDSDGKLMNMTWYNSDPPFFGDIFSLNGRPLPPTPFVEVTDDRYNCGSFWLLDPNNATYCPGGNISMFGSLKVVNGTVKRTGMIFPAFTPGTLTVVSTMELV